jgi:hypothetical protein
MSPDSRTESCDEQVGEVEETWTHDMMGVEVRRVRKEQIGHEDRVRLKVYGKRRDTYQGLQGNRTNEVERLVEIASLAPQNASEVLHGLAEAHGYKLEEK